MSVGVLFSTTERFSLAPGAGACQSHISRHQNHAGHVVVCQ